jgi:hypothetical protein
MTIDRWLVVISFVLSVLVTWLFSRYYYRRSDKKRVPTFVAQSTKVLSDPELSFVPGVSALCGGLNIAKSGVVKTKIYFWNSGALSIRRDDVLEHYTIKVPGPILHHWVTKMSREVTELVSMPDANAPDVVTLHFAILEPGDGGTIEVVYAGPIRMLEFKGSCIDSSRPKILPPDPIYSLPLFKRLKVAYRGFFLFVGCVLAFALFGAGIDWIRSHYGQQVRVLSLVGDLMLILLGLLVLFGLALALWAHIERLSSPYLPPDIKE